MESDKMENLLKYKYLIGLITPIIAYGCIFAAIAVSPWFTWSKNALSDLGAHQGSNIIFNTGLIISGLLLILYTALIFERYGNIIGKIGTIILGLSGIFLLLIGVFPEQYGIIHYDVSVGFFVTFPIAMIILGITHYINWKDYILFVWGILAFIGSFTIWILIPWKTYGITGVAIPEFTSSLLGTTWLAIQSIKMHNETKKQ
ncbi:MAG: DUF998 domain-containing protein [Candidatus Njordarchaeia archaeon]